MTRRDVLTSTGLMILVMAMGMVPRNAAGQERELLSRKELQSLVKNASSAKDFQRLATHYHYQELVFRNKAQKTLDAYASLNGRYAMATKTISRADAADREYQSCLKKADESAALAAHYDGILTEMGVTPEVISAVTVSAKDAAGQGSSPAVPPASATLLAKPRPAGN